MSSLRGLSTVFLLSGLLAAGAFGIAAATSSEAGPNPASREAFEAALQRGRSEALVPFGLEIECTDEAGHRAAQVFPGGVAVWDDRRQFRIDRSVRDRLLAELSAAGFAGFESLYGGKATPDASAVALRVSCRISARVEGLEKTSAQHAYGEQSVALLGLADTLLDILEPLAARGVSAASLPEALAKLASGELAPETLRLRLLSLPADPAGIGMIVRIEAGRVLRQDYRPGVLIGPEATVPLGVTDLDALLDALEEAGFVNLPGALPAGGHVELEVQVLDHDHRVTARPFQRLPADSFGTERSRFERLVERIAALGR